MAMYTVPLNHVGITLAQRYIYYIEIEWLALRWHMQGLVGLSAEDQPWQLSRPDEQNDIGPKP